MSDRADDNTREWPNFQHVDEDGAVRTFWLNPGLWELAGTRIDEHGAQIQTYRTRRNQFFGDFEDRAMPLPEG